MRHKDCPAETNEGDAFHFRLSQPEGTYFKSDRVWVCSGCGEIEED